MDVNRFLKLTASDEWHTAPEIVARLDESRYWSSRDRQNSPAWRLHHVLNQLRHLRNDDGARHFARLPVLAPDGSTTLVYKQYRLITSAVKARRRRPAQASKRP